MTGHGSPATALRVHAQGLYYLEAAAELLISHHTWLHRRDFSGLINTFPASDGTGLAHIDWHVAISALRNGQLPCSSSESAILRIAASLAEGIPVDLRDALSNLDHNNTLLVTRAVEHATGNHLKLDPLK
jgi:hypothetical protein